MENKKRMPATVLAQMEVFDYLKEKVGERKTRTEAYCDLLDKAMAGFVSSYLRRQDYELRPCQCHVTVSDLAVEWRWHRATVRSFLDTLESFGLLTRIRLPKSVVITMAVQSGQPAPADDVQSVSGLAAQLREVLSDWVVGYADSSATGSACGQLVRSAMTASGVRVDPDKASKDDDPLAVGIHATAYGVYRPGCHAARAAPVEVRRSSGVHGFLPSRSRRGVVVAHRDLQGACGAHSRCRSGRDDHRAGRNARGPQIVPQVLSGACGTRTGGGGLTRRPETEFV